MLGCSHGRLGRQAGDELLVYGGGPDVHAAHQHCRQVHGHHMGLNGVGALIIAVLVLRSHQNTGQLKVALAARTSPWTPQSSITLNCTTLSQACPDGHAHTQVMPAHAHPHTQESPGVSMHHIQSSQDVHPKPEQARMDMHMRLHANCPPPS